MAHEPFDLKDIYDKSLELCNDKTFHFVSDIIASLPCGRSTFYSLIPKDSDNLNNIKEILEQNCIEEKRAIRKKLSKSDKSGELLALYKLIGTEEDRRKLSQTHLDIKSDNEPIGLEINFVKREKKED